MNVLCMFNLLSCDTHHDVTNSKVSAMVRNVKN